MATFLRGFTFHQNRFLQQYAATGLTVLPKPVLLHNELVFWTHCLLTHDQFTPIPTIIPDPPYIAFHFYSDAAGPTHTLSLSGHHFATTVVDPGAANIGFLPASFSHLPQTAFFSSVLTWPLPFLTFAPAHSTLAEFLALLLPFLGLKQKLPGHMIVLHVDNMACVDLWASRVCKHDEIAEVPDSERNCT